MIYAVTNFQSYRFHVREMLCQSINKAKLHDNELLPERFQVGFEELEFLTI